MTKLRKFLLCVIAVCLVLLAFLLGILAKDLRGQYSLTNFKAPSVFLSKHTKEKAKYQGFADIMAFRLNNLWHEAKELEGIEKASLKELDTIADDPEPRLAFLRRYEDKYQNVAGRCKDSLVCRLAFSDSLLDSTVSSYNQAVEALCAWATADVSVTLEGMLVTKLKARGDELNRRDPYSYSNQEQMYEDALALRAITDSIKILGGHGPFFKDLKVKFKARAAERLQMAAENVEWIIAKYGLHYTPGSLPGPTLEGVESQKGRTCPHHKVDEVK